MSEHIPHEPEPVHNWLYNDSLPKKFAEVNTEDQPRVKQLYRERELEVIGAYLKTYGELPMTSVDENDTKRYQSHIDVLKENLLREAIAQVAREKERKTNLLSGTEAVSAFQREVKRKEREGGGECMALVRIDLDGFKHINDTLGHQRADDVLREVGKTIEHTIRGTDYGIHHSGDEFGLLLTDIKIEEIDKAVGRIIAEIEKIIIPSPSGETAELHVSVGVRIFSSDEIPSGHKKVSEYETLFKKFDTQADAAAQVAKQLKVRDGKRIPGADRIINFARKEAVLSELNITERTRSAIEAALRRIIAEARTTHPQWDQKRIDELLDALTHMLTPEGSNGGSKPTA